MSSPAERVVRSASPSSGSESEDEGDMIGLKDIKTIGQMYREGLLKAPKAARVKKTPDVDLLERISLFQGDITKLEIDAIVNAANKSLLGGGGVDGAIHAAAGPKLLSECRQLNGCLTGQSKITRGYDLPAAHVIHTVGPVYSFDSSADLEVKAEQLASCYETSLQLTVENSLKSIAFPCVSTGIYGYPIEDATHIALEVARDFAETEEGSKLERIIFTIWTQRDKGVYEDLLPLYFPSVVEESPSDEPASGTEEPSVPEASIAGVKRRRSASPASVA